VEDCTLETELETDFGEDVEGVLQIIVSILFASLPSLNLT
jgi:hypothetical protein